MRVWGIAAGRRGGTLEVVNRLGGSFGFVITAWALVRELRTPKGSGTRHGRVAGLVPYDFRRPTSARALERMWNPTDSRLVVPAVFGVGWTLNVGRLLAPLRAGAATHSSRRPARTRWGNRVVLALLRSPLHGALSGMCELRFTGRRSGRLVVLPVQYARAADRVVINVGRPAHKRWWRNFTSAHTVDVRIHRVLSHGVGRVVDSRAPDRGEAERIYTMAHPRAMVSGQSPLVVIDLNPSPTVKGPPSDVADAQAAVVIDTSHGR